MLLVTSQIFKDFLIKNNIETNAVISIVPCIVEYKKGGKLMAKVEVLNKRNFKLLLNGLNKYWIRGSEF